MDKHQGPIVKQVPRLEERIAAMLISGELIRLPSGIIVPADSELARLLKSQAGEPSKE